MLANEVGGEEAQEGNDAERQRGEYDQQSRGSD